LEVQVLLFGRLTELTGQHTLRIGNVADTDAVRKQLMATYPELAQLRYQIAVNQSIIHGNAPLSDGMTVALMPPFSGG